jgi:hypothetical protein
MAYLPPRRRDGCTSGYVGAVSQPATYLHRMSSPIRMRSPIPSSRTSTLRVLPVCAAVVPRAHIEAARLLSFAVLCIGIARIGAAAQADGYAAAELKVRSTRRYSKCLAGTS